jgi:two-component sensor histidine kinase
MSNGSLSFAILEDSDSDYDLVTDYLRRQGFHFDPVRIADRKEFEILLSGQEPDLLISDFSLPGFNALDALKATRKQWKDLPVIIISGTLGEEALVDLFRSGATDFIPKDKMFRLGPAVTRSLEDRLHRRALNDAENRVVNLLREKNELLLELHDRVKNNLQIMLSIIRMELDSVVSEESKIRIQRLRDRIWSMALVHQEIYDVDDFTCIDFQKHVSKLVSDLSDFYRCPSSRIEIRNKIGSHCLPIKTVMPCAMIAQEVMSIILGNHSEEREGGSVILDFESQQNCYFFSIIDDGKGLPRLCDDTLVTEISRLIIQHASQQLGGEAVISFDPCLSVGVSFPKDKA